MRKLLKEHFKDLLKEEIDYSSKTATVYHLTGFKTADYDPVYKSRMAKTNRDLRDEIEAKYAGKEKTRAQSILSNIKYKASIKDLKKFKTPQGQAYYIADNVRNAAYDLGSHFTPGDGKMYAEGLYTCYNLNPVIAKTYGSVILRFEVKLKNFFIFNAGIAKGIYGENFRLEDQFLEMCKNRKVDLRAFFNQEISLEDISPDATDALSDYYEMLSQMSERPEFLNSDIDTKLRTAPMALHALKEYSRQFHNGNSGLLRDLIDGIIFYGLGDGPVCVIYHPRVSKNYALTGTGYFNKKGEPVIEYIPEKLVGRSGTSLKDTFSFAQELNAEEIEEYEATRSANLKQKLASFTKDVGDDSDFFESFPSKLYNIVNPLESVYGEACEDIIISRVKDTQPEFDNYCKDIAEAYKYIQFICSILAEPFLDFVNIFGPGIDIVSKDEFEKYCYILKQYAFSAKEYPPKLADFELNGLKCVAQNEKEFSSLAQQELGSLTDKFRKMFDEGLANEFVNKIYDDCVGGGDVCVVNNSVAKFKLDQVSLSKENDGQALKDSLSSKSSIVNDVEQELIDLFNNESLKTPKGKSFLRNVFQYDSPINIEDGTLNFDNISQKFGFYSDFCQGGGDIFYTLHENVGKINMGAEAYVIDKNTFNPEFILQRMYDVKSGYALKEAAGIIQEMFKEGRKAYDTANAISFDFVKKKVMDDKIGNLSWVVEDMFSLPVEREKIII